MNTNVKHATRMLRMFGRFKVPMLGYTRPRVVAISTERVEVVIPLRRRTRNHLNSMYFGALAVGADCAGGLLAMQAIEASGQKVSLVFKDFEARFLRRPTGDVHFSCEDGPGIVALVAETLESGERVEMPLQITAVVPSEDPDEPVADFVLTLSLKKRA